VRETFHVHLVRQRQHGLHVDARGCEQAVEQGLAFDDGPVIGARHRDELADQ
jgi:hypothetical protein